MAAAAAGHAHTGDAYAIRRTQRFLRGDARLELRARLDR
jgi:hypothetical protein